MKKIFLVFVSILVSSIVARATEKITEVKSPRDAMAIYNEIKNQGKIPNISDIMAKHSSADLANLLKDITLKPITGYPDEKKLFRVMGVIKGSVYDSDGIKIGQLVRTN